MRLLAYIWSFSRHRDYLRMAKSTTVEATYKFCGAVMVVSGT
jgi:hypothetical protein